MEHDAERARIDIADRKAGDRDRSRVLAGCDRAAGRVHRPIVDADDADRRGRDVAADQPVEGREGDRAAGAGAVRGWIVAGIGEADRIEHRLVGCGAGAAGEGKDSGQRIVGAGDPPDGVKVSWSPATKPAVIATVAPLPWTGRDR